MTVATGMRERAPESSPPVAGAPRLRRRPALGIAGVLLVLLGGLATATLVGAAGDRVEVIAVARDVPVGTSVQPADLGVVRVAADPGLRPVPAGARDRIVGLVAGDGA